MNIEQCIPNPNTQITNNNNDYNIYIRYKYKFLTATIQDSAIIKYPITKMIS